MNDILAVAAHWWSLPLGLLFTGLSLGFAPSFLLRQIVRLYPKGDERRKELFAELHSLKYLQRIPWVFDQLETGLADGLRKRRRLRHSEVPLSNAQAWVDWAFERAESSGQDPLKLVAHASNGRFIFRLQDSPGQPVYSIEIPPSLRSELDGPD